MEAVRRNTGDEIPIQVPEITSTNLSHFGILLETCNYRNSLYPVSSRPPIRSPSRISSMTALEGYIRRRYIPINQRLDRVENMLSNILNKRLYIVLTYKHS